MFSINIGKKYEVVNEKVVLIRKRMLFGFNDVIYVVSNVMFSSIILVFVMCCWWLVVLLIMWKYMLCDKVLVMVSKRLLVVDSVVVNVFVVINLDNMYGSFVILGVVSMIMFGCIIIFVYCMMLLLLMLCRVNMVGLILCYGMIYCGRLVNGVLIRCCSRLSLMSVVSVGVEIYSSVMKISV